MDTDLSTSVERGIARLTLDRPARRNAMTPAMRVAITHCLDEWKDDAAVRVLVVEGAGEHFCAGSDMGMAGRQAAAERLATFTALERFPKPAVALVRGACIGAGLALAACCDVVLASDDAFFAVPELRLGFTPGALTPLFLRALGERGFRRYVLSGERFGAAEAHRLGFVHEVVPGGVIVRRCEEICSEFLRAAPGAIASAKAMARGDVAGVIESLIADEEKAIAGEEAREGLAAAREKRKPSWDA
jgi:methylglutaconyl-CoA hydratase